MSKIKQVLRLRIEGYSFKAIIRETKVSKNTVKKYIRLQEAGIHSKEELLRWEDEKLEAYFLRQSQPSSAGRDQEFEELYPYFKEELKRTGVTRWVLWGEYKQSYSGGYAYARFCSYLSELGKREKCSLHIQEECGDKIFVDFAGSKLSIVDRQTGEVTEVEVFVAVLGYSQLTYVEAVESQKQEHVIGACANALHYIGGVPKALVCDNLKAAVDKACKYEPKVNETFDDFANYYGMAVLPTRARKPQDKPLVERHVNIAYSRIYAPLRNRIFFDIHQLNIAIREELNKHNDTRFQHGDYTRREIFEQQERALLEPLPIDIYQLKRFKEMKVPKNYHIYFKEDNHNYSVPYQYTGQKVKVVYVRSSISIYANGERIAYHLRNTTSDKYTTVKEHLPPNHKFYKGWSPDFFLRKAIDISPEVYDYIQVILKSKAHPEQMYKTCLGILSLERKAGNQQLTAACKTGSQLGAYSLTFIRRVIENGFAKTDNSTDPQTCIPFHENIRGKDYYK